MKPRQILAVTVAVLLTAGACMAQTHPAKSGESAYARLDALKLAESLSSLGMSELLEAMVSTQAPGAAGNPDEMMLLAQRKIDDAGRAKDPAARGAILDEAVKLLTQIVEASVKPATEEARLKSYEARLKLADTLGYVRPQVQAMRLQYLQAIDQDRKVVVDSTGEAVAILRKLRVEIGNMLMTYREDKKSRMRYLDGLEQFSNLMSWKMAWICFYRASALNPADAAQLAERKTLLKEATDLIKDYIKSEGDIRFPANLLQAMIYRELKQFDSSVDNFKAALDAQSPNEIRLQAAFEAARNRIEQGRFDLAAPLVEDFKKQGLELYPGQDIRIAVYYTLLANHMYDAKATAGKDSAEAVQDRAAAQKVLLDCAIKCDKPADVSAFLEIIGWKYSDRADRLTLGPLVMIGIARVEAAKGTPEGEKAAGELIDKALAANDTAANEARPLVLWEAGNLLYRLKRIDEAAAKFSELGQKFPDHKLAFDAAVFGVQGLEEAMDQLQKQDRPVDDLRQSYINALEVLLGKWGKDPQVSPMYYTLGFQYLRAGDAGSGEARLRNLQAAVKNFAMVPQGPSYFDARRRGLDIQYQLLRENPQAPKDPRGCNDVVTALNTFAADVAKAAAAETNASAADQLKLWAATAAFRSVQIRYELIGQKDSLRDVQKILTDYKDTPVIPDVKGWEITTLVVSPDASAVNDAIAKAAEFQKSDPAAAGEVLGVVVDRVRARIDAVKKDRSEAAKSELERLQKAYMDFASVLFEKKRNDANATPEELYSARQMEASALFEIGKYEESLKLWQQCAAEEQQRRAGQMKIIEADLVSLAQEVKGVRDPLEKLAKVLEPFELDAARDAEDTEDTYKKKQAELDLRPEYKDANQYIDKLRGLLAGYEKMMEAKKVGETLQSRLVKVSLDAIAKAPSGQIRIARMLEMTDRLNTGLAEIRKTLSAQLEMDAANLLGQARVYRALKDYAKASKFYSDLRNIDRHSFPDFYWQIQLEYCQCLLEGQADNKTMMKQLVVAIGQLYNEDPEMGGRRGDFNMVKDAAESHSK